jgi:omega-amidase
MSSLTITGIQSSIFWEDREANLRMLEQKIMSIPQSAEVVVLPELFSTGFSMRPEKLAEPMGGPAVTWMKRLAAAKKIVLTGSLIIEEGGKYYNRLVWMQPDGQYGCYDKRHLFAYGEEHLHYTAGDRRLIASVKGWKINLLVCYDLRFPVWSRQQPDAEFEYDVLIYVANWPERRTTAWQSLLRARAIENQCYVIGVNRVGEDGSKIYHSGDSLAIDPLGNILYHKQDGEDIFSVTLEKAQLEEVRKKYPFWRDADHFRINC